MIDKDLIENSRIQDETDTEPKNKRDKLTTGCRIGLGERVKTIEKTTILFDAVKQSVDVSSLIRRPQLVLLTPYVTAHPIFIGEKANYRGIFHNRAFSRNIDSYDEKDYTLTIKGGDLFNLDGVKQSLRRISRKQIPGACHLGESETEFDATAALQLLALKKLGRLTFTAYPIDVRSIDQVPNSKGGFVSVKDFMNSAEYPDISPDMRGNWKIPQGIPLGDLLIGEYGLHPSEYLYVIEGLNIRCNELASLPYFGQANDYLGDDPLARNESGISKYGVILAHEGKGFDDTIRAVYQILGRAYGFDPTLVLPQDQITETNYLKTIQKIPQLAQKNGIATLVLDKFIDRVTEVAALGHAAGYTFSPPDLETGGSLISRNVTYNGVVLDLDTVRLLEDGAEVYITKDFQEMVLSVACMLRLVTASYPEGLFEKIQDTYLAKSKQYSDSQIQIDGIESAIQRDKLSSEVMKSLLFSRV